MRMNLCRLARRALRLRAGMKLFETYIVRRVGMMFLVALLPVLAIIWTTQVLQRINLVTDSARGGPAFSIRRKNRM